MDLRNRIAMAPMGVEIVEGDGQVREPTVRYYEERARGGVGLLITENTSACYPRGANTAHEIGLSNDSFLPGLRALTSAVQRHGAKIAVQLAHHGKVARDDMRQGRELLMPSLPREAGPLGPLDLSGEEIGLLMRATGGNPPKFRAATHEDLEGLVADFADAAARAQQAGFDAIELHGAHGYIFSEFLSRATNFREDEYGGSVENRARLLCETLRACKRRVGEDFPIWCRIDAVEFGTPDGIEFGDAQQTAELLESAGADAISVSAYANPLGAGFTEAPIVHREAGYLDFAAGIKRRVSIPTIAVGRIEPEVGDAAIRSGNADVIAMGRKLLADPELANKLSEDRARDIRPCIYCYLCVAQPFFDRTVRCAVNPMAAREAEFAQVLRSPAAEPKRVLVVGGGPAGMEAARIAAIRGHDVILCEQSQELGGTLRFAALVYEPNERLLRWLENQVRSLPIELLLGQKATAESIRELRPDVVLAAPGTIRQRPQIPGADLPHVFDGDDLRALLSGDETPEQSASLSLAGRLAVRAGRASGISRDPSKLRSASRAYMPLGRQIAIVGGGLVGIELAEFLAERDRNVIVLEAGPVMALEMAHPRRWRALHDLRSAGVRLVNSAEVESIDESGVHFRTAEGTEQTPADHVILAAGLAPDSDGIEALRESGVPLVAIGDGRELGYLERAMREGFDAAIDL
ncbi:MAG: FAD-dependent oxidoreductase [bacterium]|nr:FAD-dependent oxidoreductase [bacterium]